MKVSLLNFERLNVKIDRKNLFLMRKMENNANFSLDLVLYILK